MLKLEKEKLWWISVLHNHPASLLLSDIIHLPVLVKVFQKSRTNSIYIYISSIRKSKFVLPPPFCYIQTLNGLLDDVHPPLVRAIFFIQSFNSNANFCGYNLTNTPRNNVLPAVCTSLNPVKLTRKSNHPSIPTQLLPR